MEVSVLEQELGALDDWLDIKVEPIMVAANVGGDFERGSTGAA